MLSLGLTSYFQSSCEVTHDRKASPQINKVPLYGEGHPPENVSFPSGQVVDEKRSDSPALCLPSRHDQKDRVTGPAGQPLHGHTLRIKFVRFGSIKSHPVWFRVEIHPLLEEGA